MTPADNLPITPFRHLPGTPCLPCRIYLVSGRQQVGLQSNSKQYAEFPAGYALFTRARQTSGNRSRTESSGSSWGVWRKGQVAALPFWLICIKNFPNNTSRTTYD